MTKGRMTASTTMIATTATLGRIEGEATHLSIMTVGFCAGDDFFFCVTNPALELRRSHTVYAGKERTMCIVQSILACTSFGSEAQLWWLVSGGAPPPSLHTSCNSTSLLDEVTTFPILYIMYIFRYVHFNLHNNVSLWFRINSFARPFEHPTATCPHPVVHAGQKCPQFNAESRHELFLLWALLVHSTILTKNIAKKILLKNTYNYIHTKCRKTGKTQNAKGSDLARHPVVQAQSRFRATDPGSVLVCSVALFQDMLSSANCEDPDHRVQTLVSNRVVVVVGRGGEG